MSLRQPFLYLLDHCFKTVSSLISLWKQDLSSDNIAQKGSSNCGKLTPKHKYYRNHKYTRSKEQTNIWRIHPLILTEMTGHKLLIEHKIDPTPQKLKPKRGLLQLHIYLHNPHCPRQEVIWWGSFHAHFHPANSNQIWFGQKTSENWL